MERTASEDAYSFLRKVVGLIAVSLPFVLVLGDAAIDRIDDDPTNSGIPLGSISIYYYERTGGWFVGSLFALAVFFLSYDYRPDRPGNARKGRSPDNRMSTFASAMAVGVALFPTSGPEVDETDGTLLVEVVHFVCAATLFVLLAVFSLYQFTKTGGEVTATTPWRERLVRIFRTAPEHEDKMTPQKIRRNRLYRVCGWTIVVCIVIAAASNVVDDRLFRGSFFWAEAVAIVAFGISWLVKGGFAGWLADPDPDPQSPTAAGPA